MRYRFRAVLGAAALAVSLAVPVSAQTTRVLVNNREVDFPDQQPVEREGRVYIPLRGVLDRIGAETIQWRPGRGEVFVASGPRELLLRVGDNRARVDGQDVELDAPPILLGGRTMVPLRFVGENLGATVRWQGDTHTVFINVPQSRVAGQREVYPPARTEGDTERPRPNPPAERTRAAAPLIRPLRPVPGEAVTTRRPEIAVVVRDRNGPEIDFDSIRMRVNGEDVTPELEIGVNSVTYRPAEDLEPGVTRVHLTVRDRDGNVATRDWSFRVR